MATPIPFAPTRATLGQLKAADITRPGSLITSALRGLSDTAEQVGEQRVADAQNVFQKELITANKAGNFNNVSLDNLNSVGANAQELTAAETALRTSQLDVLDRSSQADFQSNFDTNADALRRSVSQFSEANPDLQNIVTVDNSGTLQFSPDPNFTNDQIASAKDSIARSLQAPDSGFVPLRNERELTADLNARVRELGGSQEDANKTVSNFKAFRKGFIELNDEEKTILGRLNEKTDLRLKEAQQLLNSIKVAKEIEFGITTENAFAKLQVDETDIQDYIRDKLNTEQFFSTGGSDAQDDIRALLINKKTKEGTPIKPWMILETLISTADPEEGHQTYLEGQFMDRLESIAKDSPRINQIHEAANLDEIQKEQALKNENQHLLAVNGNLAQVKSQSGVRNFPFNRSIAERTVAEEIQRINNVAPENGAIETGAAVPVQTAPAIQPIPAGNTDSSVILSPVSEDDDILGESRITNSNKSVISVNGVPSQSSAGNGSRILPEIQETGGSSVVVNRPSGIGEQFNELLRSFGVGNNEGSAAVSTPQAPLSAGTINRGGGGINEFVTTQVAGSGAEVLTGISNSPGDYVNWVINFQRQFGNTEAALKELLSHPKLANNVKARNRIANAWIDIQSN